MESSDGSSEVTPAEVLAAFDDRDDPGRPLTAAEVADAVDRQLGAVERTMESLAEERTLRSREVTGEPVWWRPTERPASEQESVGDGEVTAQDSDQDTEGSVQDAEGSVQDAEDSAEDAGDRDEEFRAFVEAVEDYAIFTLDPGGCVRTWNQGAKHLKGYRREEIVGEHLSTFYPEPAKAERLLERSAEQGRATDEGWRLRKDGSRFWASIVLTAIYDGDELRGFTKVTRDETERKRHEDRIAALHEMSRGLLEVEPETAEVVCDVVVEAATAGLDLPVVAVFLYDESEGALRRVAATDAAERLAATVPLFDPGADLAWEVFADSKQTVLEDLDVGIDPVLEDDGVDTGDASAETGAVSAADPSLADPASPTHDSRSPTVSSAVAVPLGRHGVFVVGIPAGVRSEPDERDVAGVVAADLETALNNVERQRVLQEREASLEEQNQTLERLNRVNGVIRTITQALVDATDREEIERAVCQELATAGPYRFAWIGRYDGATETVTPSARADLGDDYIRDIEVSATGAPDGHPAGRAVHLRESQTVEDTRTDPPFEPWRKQALTKGYRSTISVPLLYGDSLYGVLTVHAAEADTFSGMERRVIEELGETIAHAINALQSKRALVGDRVVELEFLIQDRSIPLLAFAADADCEFELESIVAGADDGLRAFFSSRGATPDDVESYAEGSLALDDLRLIAADGDECRFECVLTDRSLLASIFDHGAVPRTMTVSGGEARLVVELSPGADVREFAEMLRARYPTAELSGKRTRKRQGRTPSEFRAVFENRLTDRQREVLQTAFYSGFFESPRRCTGEELGEILGVSQPTVNHHLRTCQRTLLELLYAHPSPTLQAR